MRLSLLAGYALEVAHVGSRQRATEDGQVVDPGRLCSCLVVLDEDEQRLHRLKLDETQVNRVTLQVSRLESERGNLFLFYVILFACLCLWDVRYFLCWLGTLGGIEV